MKTLVTQEYVDNKSYIMVVPSNDKSYTYETSAVMLEWDRQSYIISDGFRLNSGRQIISNKFMKRVRVDLLISANANVNMYIRHQKSDGTYTNYTITAIGGYNNSYTYTFSDVNVGDIIYVMGFRTNYTVTFYSRCYLQITEL